MRFGADTPGRQFRENSRERERRSPAVGSQGSDPPSPSTDFAEAKRESGCAAGGHGRRLALAGVQRRAGGGVCAKRARSERGAGRAAGQRARAYAGESKGRLPGEGRLPGTSARHGRDGGRFAGAGNRAATGASGRDGRLSRRDAGNRAARAPFGAGRGGLAWAARAEQVRQADARGGTWGDGHGGWRHDAARGCYLCSACVGFRRSTQWRSVPGGAAFHGIEAGKRRASRRNRATVRAAVRVTGRTGSSYRLG